MNAAETHAADHAARYGVNMSTGVVSVRLSGALKDRLDALSSTTGRPASFYVREAIEERIDALEWSYGVAARAEQIRAGQRETVPLDVVLDELGMTIEDLTADAPA